MKNYDPVLCRLWKLYHSCPLASSHYRMSFIVRNILISELLKCEKCASYNQWNMVVNIQQMLNCLKCVSPPPDTPRVCLWLQTALHFNLYLYCKSCSGFDTLFLFSFFSPAQHLLIGNYPSHLCSVPVFESAWFQSLLYLKQGQEWHAITPSRPVPSGHSGWLRDGHMIQARSDPNFCQCYQETGFLFWVD